MIDARLALALDGGGFVLPDDGAIAVFKPPQDAELSVLPQDRCLIIEGFKPAHDAWCARGFDCVTELNRRVGAAIVCLPRAKAEARALIAEAMEKSEGSLVIDGQKTDGVDSLLREIRKRIDIFGPIAKAHGKLFWCSADSASVFDDWRTGPALTAGGFWTAPGVFSADAIDPASDLLAAALPENLGKEIADFGAGWGFLSAHILTRAEVSAVHLVEAGHMALECARRNVTDPRAVFHWADATTWRPEKKLDAVIMNPPFHTTRAAEPTLGQGFVQAAARALSPSGQLWMVANRHLPYEQTLMSHFANVFEVGGDARFKLLHATRPKHPARP
ncbi:class I SAM-dependent methyltransferase [Roseobacter weihaiensis]|uniref:class I SAM-dependent methyltransferase n=1 Tax=Roseobacter weihaiensis TaxID=2763262 RepID=UPI001D09BDA3|nr:class I SAM-dependent methyltransferase [Roseobacter sp. H9]